MLPSTPMEDQVALTKDVDSFQEHAAQVPPIPSPTPPPIPTSTSPPPPIPSPTPPPIPTSTSPPPPIPSPTPPPIPTSTSPPPPITSPPPPPETEPTTDEYLYEEHSPVHHHFSPSQEQAPSRMPMDDLLHTLVKKVKKLEGFLKRRNLVLTDSEDEEPEAQGRKSQADPQDSSIQGLVTPPTTKAHASGEEQVEDISPNTLEAAKTLSKVASLKSRSIDKGRRYKRRKETKGKKVVSSLDFQEDDAVAEKINTAGEINAAKRGKAPMLSEETPKKSKEQILQEEASLAEAIRLDSLQKEEEAKQIHLDALLAQRIAEEEELTEQQKKKKENAQSMLGSELQGEDFAKRMVDINQGIMEDKSALKKLSCARSQGRASLKRFGEELQTKTPKRLKEDKDDESKEDESTKKSGKRRKQMARKGMNTSVDENDSEDSDKVGKHEESNTGTETPINPVPVAMKTLVLDSNEIVMGMDGPEDKLEKGFWKCLRIMFKGTS
ncbi:hypothetical protein Tco_1360616 [Tanacetum coccineum]